MLENNIHSIVGLAKSEKALNTVTGTSLCVGGGGGGGGGATGLLNKGRGSNRLPCLVTKQQAVEFPQVLCLLQKLIHLKSRFILPMYYQVVPLTKLKLKKIIYL